MNASHRLLRHFAILLATIVLGSFGPADAAIRLPANAPACVRWAAQDVSTALRAAHVPAGAPDIRVEIAGDVLPEQAFRLAAQGSRVTITGGDSVGAMYGLLELAEQIRNGSGHNRWQQVAAALSSTEQKPFVEFRADNAFIQTDPLLINDVEMWKQYIDMLARSRFNVLDLHGGFNLENTGFPNLYPLLIHVPEYPEVGNAQEQARNLADFKTIVAYAGSRGIRVAFMNYSAGVHGVPREKLADYTAKAVAALLKAVPDLYMLGFRVGESGQPASFYQEAYLKGVADSGRKDIRLYSRSWQTTKDQLDPIGTAYNGRFDIEIKYNGEQLGLPYPALQGGYGSYSYQGYLDVPAPYRIIWQVRANGTHRFWSWADSDFIRRTVRTFTLGNARGFTLEPQTAYFTPRNASYYKSPADQKVYQYRWEKNWMWYLDWGRLGYNPDLPEATLVGAYREHFGPEAEHVYRAVQASGPIVPLALAYRFQGPDHRNHSPETETGAFYGHQSKGEVIDPLTFARNVPMDRQSFVGIDNFVNRKLAGKTDGRIGPAWAARLFQQAAMNTRQAVSEVGPLDGHAGDEWRLLKVDLLSASFLADYYAARILGTLHLDYALKTGSQTDYDRGIQYLADSRVAWSNLARTADAVYAPLLNRLRNQVDYQWGSQIAPLEKLDAMAHEMWAKRGQDPAAKPLVLTPAEEGRDTGIRVRDLRDSLKPEGSAAITCQVQAPAGQAITEVRLWYKDLPSEAKWDSHTMTGTEDGGFSLTVPVSTEGLLYYVEAHDAAGDAADYPFTLEETPYQMIEPRAP